MTTIDIAMEVEPFTRQRTPNLVLDGTEATAVPALPQQVPPHRLGLGLWQFLL